MRIGILTSGGDCPGINATIRGVCKTAINHYGMEVIGIHSGFQGLLTKDVESFTDKSLSGLLNQGGTMLGTSREKPFKKNGVMSDVNKPALIEQNVKELGLDCLPRGLRAVVKAEHLAVREESAVMLRFLRRTALSMDVYNDLFHSHNS